MTTIGSGKLSFQPADGWAKLPEEHAFRECPAVAVDAQDNVYLFVRGGKESVLVLDKDGNLLRAWGKSDFTDSRTHGISVDPDGNLWLVDDSQHCAKKYTPDGRLLMTIGAENQAAEKWSGVPFNRPTQAVVSANTGDVYISDGYGNSRVHRFSSEGKHVVSWGSPGCEPGEFQRPHNVVIDENEIVYVADRENNRVQVFDKDGKIQAVWHDIYRPDGMCMGPDGHIYVGELNAQAGMEDCPGLGHRVSVFNRQGQRVARLGDVEDGEGPGQFIAPHSVAVDSQGNLYVGDVSYTMRGSRLDPPRVMRSFQRLNRVG